MDIIDIIDRHIELSVRRDNLYNTIENSKRYYDGATIEGDMAFHAKDYKLEQQYNNSARNEIENQHKAEKDFAQIKQLLELSYQTYTEAVESLNGEQLREASITISAKKGNAERKIEKLSQRRNWANSKGDIAFSEHNHYDEQEYNRISLECYTEIERTKQTLYYYDFFANDLNYHNNKKVAQNLGSKGPAK